MTELRRIDVSHEQPVTPREQPAPQLLWVKIADLRVDETFQRPLAPGNWAAIRRIAAAFDWASFGPVVVAPIPGGLFSVIDGQHRTHAAAICGFDSVPAVVVPIAREAQAKAFGAINGATVRVNQWALFKAALAAGDAGWIAARDAVAAADCTLMTSNKTGSEKRAGQVFALALVRSYTDAGQGWAVTAALSALRRVDGGRKVQLYCDYILRPLFGAVAALPGVSVDALAAALGQVDLFRVIEGARDARGALSSKEAQKAVLAALSRRVAV